MNSTCDRDAEQLVSLCKAGDDAAFESLVDLYKPMIVKTARDFGIDLREIYSDACLSLKRAAMSYVLGGEVTFGLYAKICVSRSMIDYAKRNKVALGAVNFNVEDVAVADGVQKRLEREEELAALDRKAKHLLSELEYEVFSLCMKGYKTSEIAEKLAIGAKSVDNAKARMLKRLRTGLASDPKN